uniref:Uncharacterized protein n=1 Tax=Romanomermis culicivorax TaxID=13658 RepID=A0A915J067_ROMCU
MLKIVNVVFLRCGTSSHWSQKFLCSTAVKTKVIDEVDNKKTPSMEQPVPAAQIDNEIAFSNRRRNEMRVIKSFDKNVGDSASADYDPMKKLLEATKKVNEFDKQNPFKSHSVKVEPLRPSVSGANSTPIRRVR